MALQDKHTAIADSLPAVSKPTTAPTPANRAASKPSTVAPTPVAAATLRAAAAAIATIDAAAESTSPTNTPLSSDYRIKPPDIADSPSVPTRFSCLNTGLAKQF